MQELAQATSRQNSRHFARLIEVLIYFVVTIHLIANFLASPLVQYTYLLLCSLMFITALYLEPSRSIWFFIIFSLYEGQGRIIWGYAPWARIAFDLCLTFAITKNIIVTKKIWDRNSLPQYINILISLHFIWFVIELFNPSGAGFFASFATSKFYIFPFLFFFYCLQIPLDFNCVKNQRKIVFILLNLFVIAILTIVQEAGKEDFMGAMSGHYLNLFKKFAIFQDYTFRPWGTSYVPGGMSSFYYLMLGFCFLLRPRLLARNIYARLLLSALKYLTIVSLAYSCFISDVRSATMKLVGLLVLVFIADFIKTKFKFKKIVALSSAFAVVYLMALSFDHQNLVENLEIEHTVDRWVKLGEEGIGKQRNGLDEVLKAVTARVELPLGYGLGMTTSFLPSYEERRKSIVGRSKYAYWNMDNFFVFLTLELGLGALFYIALLIAIVIALVSMMFRALHQKRLVEYTTISISASLALLVFVGNWGAASLVYNPESFYFWFWVALAFNQYRKGSSLVGNEDLVKQKSLS